MFINTDMRADFPDFSSELWDVLETTVSQAVTVEGANTLSAKVLPSGRYTARATNSKRSNPTPKVKISTLGNEEESYLRPNGSRYFPRSWGDHKDVSTLQKAREMTAASYSSESESSAMFALLYGAPGCGKTALVEAAFSKVYTLMGTGDTEVADMVGGYVQTPGGGFEWVDGDLVRAAEEGAVYFIDEIGLIDPKVLSTVYGLMDGRRELTVTANPERGTVKAHPEFYVIAATNPNAPGVRLSEALLSRFTLQVEMTTDWTLAKKLGAPVHVVTAAQNLNKKQISGEVSWAPQMRELLAFRDIDSTFGTDFAIANLLAVAPELDRAVVADVMSRVYGTEHKPAKI